MDQRLSFYLNNKNFSKSSLNKNIEKESLIIPLYDDNKKPNIYNIEDNTNQEIITSSTFLGNEKEKRGIKTTKLIGKWSIIETEKFFKLLELCGTELSLIEKCFDHKNRKQIKMKLKKEMKINLNRIEKILDAAKFDVKEYEKFL